MTRIRTLLPVVILSLSGWSVSVAGDAGAGMATHWFYMVKTKPSEPARDAEFNRWYDDIDIPDVLAVPGFMRARRAIKQEVPEISSLPPAADDSKYVALYDIETTDIDTSIIDLYVAARKMGALGRLTDVLKVVEANYYRRLVAPFEKSAPETAGTHQYIHVKKIICCRDAAARDRFYDWYTGTFIPEIMTVKGLVKINFYELYRVMEVLAVGPEEIPHMLAVYEIEADSAAQTIGDIQTIADRLKAEDDMGRLYLDGDSSVYLQMSDKQPKGD